MSLGMGKVHWEWVSVLQALKHSSFIAQCPSHCLKPNESSILGAGFDRQTNCIMWPCWPRLAKEMGSWTIPALLCLLALCGRSEARAALPSVSAPDPGPRRSAIYVSTVPVAQAPSGSDFVNLPSTKAVVHLDDVMAHLRPSQGPVEANAKDFREDLKIMLQKANAVAALRRAGLLRGSSSAIPSYLQNRTVEFLNLHAPSMETPAGAIRPVLSQQVKVPSTVKSFTDTNSQSISYSAGSVIEFLLGVRLATPFFGTGFNFCIGESPSLTFHMHYTSAPMGT